MKPHPDDEATAATLAAALHRTAERVQPTPDGLGRILDAVRSPTAEAVPLDVPPPDRHLTAVRVPESRPRRLVPVFAAAAAVTAVGLAGVGLQRGHLLTPPPVPPAAPTAGAAGGGPLPVYVAQRQNGRWALVREYVPTTSTSVPDRLVSALRHSLSGQVTDPDDTSAWRALGLTGDVTAQITASAHGPVEITLRLGPGLVDGPRRPTAAGEPPADLAVQQLVWTATAAAGLTVPVVILGPDTGAATGTGTGTDHVRGLALDRTFTRATAGAADVRAPVWISSLLDRSSVSPGPLTVSGDAAAGPGDVGWQLREVGSGRVVAAGTAALTSAPGAGERRVWSVPLRLDTPGVFELVVSRPWPGAPEAPPWTDTKTVLVS